MKYAQRARQQRETRGRRANDLAVGFEGQRGAGRDGHGGPAREVDGGVAQVRAAIDAWQQVGGERGARYVAEDDDVELAVRAGRFRSDVHTAAEVRAVRDGDELRGAGVGRMVVHADPDLDRPVAGDGAQRAVEVGGGA